MLQAEAVGETHEDPDVQEVRNYIRAFDHGLLRLHDLPISQRLMSELHAVLMQGVEET